MAKTRKRNQGLRLFQQQNRIAIGEGAHRSEWSKYQEDLDSKEHLEISHLNKSR